MKVSPLSGPGASIGAVTSGDPQATRIQSTRLIKMNTNATPGRVEQPIETHPPGPDAAPVSTSDVSSQASEENEDTKPLSPQFAALAKQKRALQVKEREIQAREEALKAAPQAQGDAVTLADLKADPLGHLFKAGLSYEDLAQAVMSRQDGGNPELVSMQRKLEDIEKGFDKKLSDRDAQAEKQALAEMQREATQLVDADEAFEMVKATKSVPKVMELIERTYRESGEVLDVKEALSLIEEELFQDALQKSQLKKVQAKLAPQPAQTSLPAQRQMRTLTNRDTATAPMSAKARAIAAFHGQLKR